MAMHIRFFFILLAALALLPGFSRAQLLPEKDIASVLKPRLKESKTAAVDILAFFKTRTAYHGSLDAVAPEAIRQLLAERNLVLVDITPEGVYLLHVPNPKNASAARADLLTHPFVLSATPSGWAIPSRKKIEFEFRAGVSQDEKADLLRDYGLSLVDALPSGAFVAVSEFSREYEKLLSTLQNNRLIKCAALR